MSEYILKLTPAVRNPGTEGSLDTSIVNGVSIQRTGYLEVVNDSNRKVVEIKDGASFTDTPETIDDTPGIDIVATD